ncbi:hypothetical protein FOPG_11843 [Fusarium oxysporum f. sp. conglutinans race 2 54008]|uniref:F-box domain-containing protein n=4 Tax=Fusarium oxysporum TaxID=5507 RepID=F9FI01_FUSOF|nr:hypothetical protein FOXB_06030 [Fusarium oxysporum f. sp. conglutinans Fo5176]EXA37675.1 hypothetical protein FOVG_11805 [Fusarium oxysporum f. sp. pisi HDV247]EXL72693.1 hypothetical protein FOPG_11843 [Fusarium oxysporum f. sp. conglutinans race 2 54008]EXM27380.1 hypothetical protein FOTG_06691 [Fusarium oxysporum f. sp. vasinfectum 25433]KAH7213887.1 hypothetical protein BKA60DRAFT_597511 [Fusarium oxysporum]KAK2671002.1 F-box domain [Fusarium oxysporum f. sp. vasinfectum]
MAFTIYYKHGQMRARLCPTAPFVVPQQLSQVKRDQSALFKTLPNEILLEITSYIEVEDRLCLGLTCKSLFYRLCQSTDFHIISASGHAYSDIPYCSHIKDLLKRMRPLTPKGQPKRTMALCCDCLRYRPKRVTYWKEMISKKNLRSLDLCAANDAAESWCTGESIQCPGCWFKGESDYIMD